MVEVRDLADASRVCRDFIAIHGLGGGNWSGGQIADEFGNVFASVSYNGKVWPAGEWTPEMKPLFVPS